MLLWDEESEDWEEALSGLSALRRREIALIGIIMAVDSVRPSFETMFADHTVTWLRQALRRCRAELTQSTAEEIGTEQFFDELHALVEQDSAPGLASLVMALSTYVDCQAGDFTPECTLDVLSASYEAVLNSERIGKVTPDAERQNDNCMRLIEAQRDLLLGRR
ncbi:hypothetical protein [Streptomyces antibioticus]|uniref:hypothetical protein n=1 Tax=Streptomyces antibioticus TaxID=1890 RepID=UPI0022598160|nr:hypothetical protein [Streptomyces antibioticus]MCX4743778.1 hypothetical protein [Streptomyces antibioticus]